jgi:hypothetical protein
MDGAMPARRLGLLVMEARSWRLGPDGHSEARLATGEMEPEKAVNLGRLLEGVRALGTLVVLVPYRQLEREFPGLQEEADAWPQAPAERGRDWLERLRHRHRVGYRDEGPVCLECGRDWPCDAALAAQEASRLGRLLDGVPPGAARSSVAVPHPGDLLISGCRTMDPFASTELDALLRSRGVDTLALTGFHTNWGLESAARSAFDRGYRVLLVSDCATADSAEAGRHCEERVFPRLGAVVNSDQLLRALGPVRELTGSGAG